MQYLFLGMRHIILLLLCSTLSSGFISAQDILGLGTKYSDSFREWEIQTAEEHRYGTLELRWPLSDDWTQWEFRLGDTTAYIRQKWSNDPNLWEIKCLGTTVTARTIWNDDFRQWRLSDGTHRIRWQSRYSNIRDEWIIREEDNGSFVVSTYWEGDPRDWVVTDELNADVSYAMRVALIFIAVFNSVPKV
jgi:hypothetical protein